MKIDVSIGELVDKVTILSIKLQKVRDAEKLRNIEHEYNLLSASMASTGITTESEEFLRLLEINKKLWDIEDRIRLMERDKQFGDEFVQLARSVYVENVACRREEEDKSENWFGYCRGEGLRGRLRRAHKHEWQRRRTGSSP